jgi:hypothetical protein
MTAKRVQDELYPDFPLWKKKKQVSRPSIQFSENTVAIVIGSGRIDKSVFVFNFDAILVFLRSSEDNISIEYHPILIYSDMPSIDLEHVIFALNLS